MAQLDVFWPKPDEKPDAVLRSAAAAGVGLSGAATLPTATIIPAIIIKIAPLKRVRTLETICVGRRLTITTIKVSAILLMLSMIDFMFLLVFAVGAVYGYV